MKCNKQIISTQVCENYTSTDERFQLDLSFIEMHIIMNAMTAYMMNGYTLARGDEEVNYSHAEAAEKLHNEMTEFYIAD